MREEVGVRMRLDAHPWAKQGMQVNEATYHQIALEPEPILSPYFTSQSWAFHDCVEPGTAPAVAFCTRLPMTTASTL